MNSGQKQYIEQNINLIEDNKWREFFEYAPGGIGAILYEAGIPFLEESSSIFNLAFCESNVQTVVIPNSITNIGPYAFGYCTCLESIVVPNSVTIIGNGVFEGCTSLANVVIGNGVTSIGDEAFYNCKSLKSIEIPDSVKSIGNSAFSDCTSLKSVVIGDSVTSIDTYTFFNCTSLKSITIPHNVTSIADNAFSACDKIGINYDGTTEEWKHLIGNNNRVFKNTTYTCNCIDGVVEN